MRSALPMAVSLSTLQHLLTHPKKFWYLFIRYSEYLLFFFRFARLRREISALPQAEKRVLFVGFSDWEARGKLDGVLGAAMLLRGAKPLVLTMRCCTWTQRYLSALGVRDFLFFDDELSAAGKDKADADILTLLPSPLTFQTLFDFTYRGINVGRNVLSTVLRQLKTGSAAFDDPAVQTMIRDCFVRSVHTADAACRFFTDKSPDAVLFLEKGYTPYGEIFDAAIAKHLDVIQYHHGHQSDRLVMRRYSEKNRFSHPFSLSQASWGRVKAMPWSSDQEQKFMDELKSGYENGSWFNRKFLLTNKNLKTPEECRRQLGLDPKKKTAVIFSHVLWDATFFFGDNLFVDYEQWLVETVRVAVQNTNVNWLIKLHPDYVWKVKQLGPTAAARDAIAIQAGIGELPSHMKIVPPEIDISTYSFFSITDYCITVRGTIGIEAPCFGIPVFTAGTGRYSGLGFTNDSSTREEYLEKMRTIHTFPALSEGETSLARRHAYALFQCRTLPFRSCEIAPSKKSGSIAQDAILRVNTLDDIRKAPDLTSFTNWVLNSREEDYLKL